MEVAEAKLEEVLSAQDASKKEGRKRKRGFIVLLIVFLVLAAGSFAAVYFNIFGTRNALDSFLKKTPFAKNLSKSQEKDLQKMYEKQIADLQKQNKTLQTKLSVLEKQNESLKKQLEDLTVKITDITSKQQDVQHRTKYFASLLQSMDPRKAAKIVENLLDTDTQIASAVLESISSETASEILSNIPPQKTIKLIGVSNSSQNSVSQDISTLIEIYKNMEPKTAALIFENMMGDSARYQLVIRILKSLDTKTSSQIISSMSAENAAKVTSSLSALK